jgi:hypothetical protein
MHEVAGGACYLAHGINVGDFVTALLLGSCPPRAGLGFQCGQ